MTKWEVFGRIVLSVFVFLGLVFGLNLVEINPNHLSVTEQIWSGAMWGGLAMFLILAIAFLRSE